MHDYFVNNISVALTCTHYYTPDTQDIHTSKVNHLCQPSKHPKYPYSFCEYPSESSVHHMKPSTEYMLYIRNVKHPQLLATDYPNAHPVQPQNQRGIELLSHRQFSVSARKPSWLTALAESILLQKPMTVHQCRSEWAAPPTSGTDTAAAVTGHAWPNTKSLTGHTWANTKRSAQI